MYIDLGDGNKANDIDITGLNLSNCSDMINTTLDTTTIGKLGTDYKC